MLVRLILPGELAKHASSEGTKSVTITYFMGCPETVALQTARLSGAFHWLHPSLMHFRVMRCPFLYLDIDTSQQAAFLFESTGSQSLLVPGWTRTAAIPTIHDGGNHTPSFADAAATITLARQPLLMGSAGASATRRMNIKEDRATRRRVSTLQYTI